MNAALVGASMPAQVSLADLAAMAAADEHHRYELSPGGCLTVTPIPDPDHALTVSRLAAWFVTGGYRPDRVTTACALDVTGGGRSRT